VPGPRHAGIQRDQEILTVMGTGDRRDEQQE
jgi:hypothetical protein